MTVEADGERLLATEGGQPERAPAQEIGAAPTAAPAPVTHSLGAISVFAPAETTEAPVEVPAAEPVQEPVAEPVDEATVREPVAEPVDEAPVEEPAPDPSRERPGAETEEHETEPVVGTRDTPAEVPVEEQEPPGAGPAPLELLDQAAAEPSEPLPRRSELEARLGRSLEGVEAHSGPSARQALDGLGADAATRGQQVFLAEPSPPLGVVAHEAVHTLQAEPDTGAPRPGGPIVPEHAPVEEEAAELANGALDDTGMARRREPEETLPAGGVALLRTGSAPVAVPPGSAATPTAAFEAATDRPGPRPAIGAQPSTAPSGSVSPSRAPGTPPSTAPATTPTTATAPAGEQAVPSLGEAAAPEPGLTPEDVAAQQEEAAQAAAALTGAESVTGLVDAFATAPPTVKAQHYAALGSNADRLSKSEESGFQETLPELHAELSGEVAEAEPVEIPTPPERALTLEATAPPETPLPELPPTPDPGEFTANDRVADDIERSFWEELLDRAAKIGQSLKDVKTTDEDIDTSAGAPPTVPLEGENNPERIDDQQQSVVDQARTTRDEAQQAVVNGPGPELVQPRVMDEAYPLGELNGPMLQGPAPVEGPEAYLAMGLPPDVQAAFDQDQQAAMEASLDGPRSDVQAATTERDTSREAEIGKAEKDVQDLTVKSDEKQRSQVKDARDQIQTERSATLQAQADAVADAEGDIETERKNRRGEIDDRVKKDEQQIRDDYAKADEDTQKEVTKGETKAEEERIKAEREAEDKSWWERAVDFVKDAFEALTSIVGAIFDAVRSAVTAILDAVKSAVLALIDLAAGFIKGLIAAFGEFLKLAVDALIGTIFPELAEKLKKKIDGAVSAAQAAVDVVADGLKAGVSAIVDGLKAGLNKIIDIYQAAVELGMGLVEAAITGDWGALARKALEAALRVAGISKEEFYGFVGRAEETYQAIIDDPGGFLGNCVDAFVGGVQKFADNFATHLQAGIINWLTGTIGGAGITLPERFDLLGVLDIARQILGLTWDRLRKRAVALIGEENVERIELVAGYLQTLIAEGWSALLEQISSAVGNVRDTVFDGIKSYLTESIIFAAIARLATLFNPVGAIVQLILAAWNLYTFLRDQMARIVAVLKSIVDTIVDIARGVIEPASLKVEQILAGLLPLAIDLLARFLNLGGAAKRFQDIVEGIRERVDKAIDWLIQKVMGLFKGKGGAKDGKPEKEEAPLVASAAQPAAPAADGEIGERLTFTADEKTHHLWFDVRGADAVLMVSSTPQSLEAWITVWQGRVANGTQKQKTKGPGLLTEADSALKVANRSADQIAAAKVAAKATPAPAGKPKPTAPTPPTAHATVLKEERHLLTILDDLFALFGDDKEPVGANEEDRFEIAQSIDMFYDQFTAKDWQARFVLGESTAFSDLQWGRDQRPLRLEPVRNVRAAYRLRLADSKLQEIAVRLVLEQGRESPLLTSPFVLDDLRKFCVANPRLPNDVTRYTNALLTKITDELVAKQEIEKDGKEFVYTPTPAQRHLPWTWEGEDVRNKYYINGSGFGSARKDVIDRDFQLIQDAIDKIRAKDPTGRDEWDDLYDKDMVEDEKYALTGKNKKPDSYYLDESKFDVDHVKPLAYHWAREGGNDSRWEVRQDLAGKNQKNLRILLSSKNRSKQAKYEVEYGVFESGRYTEKLWVGPNFTGPGSSKGATWADENTQFAKKPKP